MSELLNNAIIFATKAHHGQTRKGNNIPYILHPLEAVAIVGSMTTDEYVLAAAVLHDVVEDTRFTIDDIRKLFGEQVAFYVAAESENKREDLPAADTWKIRKEETLNHLMFAPVEIKMITLADKLSNIRAMYRDYLMLDDDLWNRFNQKDPKEHHWYYQGIATCLTELKDFPAYQEYCELINKVFVQ